VATTDTNLAGRSGALVESHRGFQPRVFFFHLLNAGLLLVLAGGLLYQQLYKTGTHNDAERTQNQRRIIVPGPRGNIYDREGRLLVGNRPRLAVVLYVDELRPEILREYRQIRKAYRASGDQGLPNDSQMWQIARTAVVQRYLDQVNVIIHRDEKVDRDDLVAHFQRQLLLPYVLIEDLEPDEYARLIEKLPVRSPLQVYTSSTRYYPYQSAAAHTLGSVKTDTDISAEDFPGKGLATFKMKGTSGRDGLEKQFDAELQGEVGGKIYLVDPSGYKKNPPLEERRPTQGKDVMTSLDIDLQLAAEEALGDQTGAAVALDVATGEVLAMASKPDYNLNETSPRISTDKYKEIEEKGGWQNRALNGLYPPGSTFKILVSIAGLRTGAIDPRDTSIDCEGRMLVGAKWFVCENGEGRHGHIALKDAIAESCDIYFYTQGLKITADGIAAEAHRFGLDQRTGVQLPYETKNMLVPTPEWKERVRGEKWFSGNTANMSIGQGDVLLTPMQMACFAASVARGQVSTHPTLMHDPKAGSQRSEPIGITAAQRAALLDGMEGCTLYGTAKVLGTKAFALPGLRIAGKTGTAQIPGKKNVAWFICFAPLEHPEIAIAVAAEGDTPGETFGGGRFAAPVAHAILKKWWEKTTNPKAPGISLQGAE
jgi:penicillin-binding protein 2